MPTAPPPIRPGRTAFAWLLATLLTAFAGMSAAAGEADEPRNTGQAPSAGSERGDSQDDAQARWQRRAERGDRLIRAALLRDLELTDEQQQRAEAIFETHAEQTRQWYREHREEVRELTRQMRDLDDDPERRRALHARAREVMDQRPKLDDLAEAFEDVLTDEQWPQYERNHERLEEAIVRRMREHAGQRPGARGARPPHARGPRHVPGSGAAFEDIELTEQQREQLREAAEAHHAQVRQWRQEHREKLSELRQNMREAREADDRERLGALREQLHTLREDQPSRDDLHARFREVLDDEQWQQLQRNWDEMRRRAEQQREQRREHQPQRRGRD